MGKAKKKTTHINKITPAVSIECGILFDNLDKGECFLMNGGLWLKESSNEQIGVNLATGKYKDCLCGSMVTPVTVTITWKKK